MLGKDPVHPPQNKDTAPILTGPQDRHSSLTPRLANSQKKSCFVKFVFLRTPVSGGGARFATNGSKDSPYSEFNFLYNFSWRGLKSEVKLRSYQVGKTGSDAQLLLREKCGVISTFCLRPSLADRRPGCRAVFCSYFRQQSRRLRGSRFQ